MYQYHLYMAIMHISSICDTIYTYDVTYISYAYTIYT